MTKVKVDDPAFWQRRLAVIDRRDWDFVAVWDTSVEEWRRVINVHRELVNSIIGNNQPYKILDAGCGQGHLLEVLSDRLSIEYTGIDISPEFISIAQEKYGESKFSVGDLRSLPFPDQYFDFSIARSVAGMVCEGLGYDVWNAMENELLRVSRKVILLNYTHPNVCKVLGLQTTARKIDPNFFKPDIVP